VESLDRLECLVLVRSLGGGTGSGLGSRILECVHEKYNSATLIDAVVAPFSSGDTPTQHYNTILSLALSQKQSDAIVFFGNDDLMQRATASRKSAPTLSGGATPSHVADSRARMASNAHTDSLIPIYTRDINVVIANSLLALSSPMRLCAPWKPGKRSLVSRNRTQSESEAAADTSRPAWVDVVSDPYKMKDPHAGAFKFSDNEGGDGAGLGEEAVGEGEEGGAVEELFGARGGWIATALSSSRPTRPVSEAAFENLTSILASDSGAGFTAPPDFVALLNSVATTPSQKFLDVRSVGAAVGGNASLLKSSWLTLAEALQEAIPRYDSAARPVTCSSMCLIARGVSEGEWREGSGGKSSGAPHSAPTSPTNAPGESPVGSSLRATSHNHQKGAPLRRSPPAGMAPLPSHWPGLPRSGEWERVSLLLTRANRWPLSGMEGCRTSMLSLSQPPPNKQAASQQGGRPAFRSLTAVGNTDYFVAPLVKTIARADALLSVGAYTHWFTRHGVEADDINNSMHELMDVVEAYRPSSR